MTTQTTLCLKKATHRDDAAISECTIASDDRLGPARDNAYNGGVGLRADFVQDGVAHRVVGNIDGIFDGVETGTAGCIVRERGEKPASVSVCEGGEGSL